MLNNTSVDNLINNSLLNKEIVSEETYLKSEIEKIHIPDKDFSIFMRYDDLISTNNNGYIKLTKNDIKKYKQEALEIRNRDKFDKDYKEFTMFKESIHKKQDLIDRLRGNTSFINSQISKSLEILYENHYISSNVFPLKKENVSLKGIVASEINECNGIVLTELIYSNMLDDFDYRDLGAILSIFSDTKPIENKDSSAEKSIYTNKYYQKQIELVHDVCNYYSKYETDIQLYNNQNWNINCYIIDPTYKWLDGEQFDSITKEYNIFEGNLIKDFLKIYNLSAEVEKIAAMLNKTDLQIEAEKIRDVILRDVVNIESLYIKPK
tara:strand:- start:4731 stop:5696 length:966 start_codon:yes stop_codon:yes gene_type:complete